MSCIYFCLPFHIQEPFCWNCCFMASYALHIPFLCIHIFPALLPHPTIPVPPSPELSICSFYLFLSCTSTLQMLPCFLNFCLLHIPHFPAKTLWKSCCIFRVPPDFPLLNPIGECVLLNCPTLLRHCNINDKTCLWQSSDFKRWRSPWQRKLGFSWIIHWRKLQGMKKLWGWRVKFDFFWEFCNDSYQ